MFTLTWKERVTPSGRLIFALRASGVPTSGSDCSSWPTPNTPSGGPNTEKTESHTGGMDLDGAAQLAAWPTPKCPDGGRVQSDEATITQKRPDGTKAEAALENVARLASWATPATRDYKDNGDLSGSMIRKDGQIRDDTLGRQASMVVTVQDAKHSSLSDSEKDRDPNNLRNQVHQALVTDSGETPSGCGAGTASTGQLNPALSRWLQGLPHVFCDCAVSATASTRKLPRRLSKRR